MKPATLTIAGSDSGGGAGVQADLRAFSSLGVSGTCAITCITAQNPSEVRGVLPVDPDMVRLQIETICDGFAVVAAKTGMLYSGAIIQEVARVVAERELPSLVVDPVMVATSGAKLLEDDAISTLCAELIPMATVLTPNLPEAEILCGHGIGSSAGIEDAAREIADKFGVACVLKGGHLANQEGMTQGDTILDVLCVDGEIRRFEGPRVNATETHGTGCMFSAALAASLAKGESVSGAVAAAKEYVHGVLSSTR
ncbi:bifunctional hydroxymethylpyrimidine kinase/phosphomethylpyrimidine kinase [Verrucomicrobiota bacterium]